MRSLSADWYPEAGFLGACWIGTDNRLLVINRTTDNKRLYRDESEGITSAF